MKLFYDHFSSGLVIPYISNFFNRIVWLMESKHFEIWSKQVHCTRYGTIINILYPVIYNTMKASLSKVSFQISRLVHWNKTMLFQNINRLITHKGFYHLCNMIYHIYWTIIIFVIDVAIILIDRRHCGFLPQRHPTYGIYLSHLPMI